MFYYYLLFQLTNETNSFIEKKYGDRNFIHIKNKLSCVSRPSRSRDELVALVVTDVSLSSRRAVSRLLNSMRDIARTTFSCTKMHELDRVS